MESYPILKRSLSSDVKKALRKYICSMSPDESIKLPSEEDIAKNYGVSRVTIRRALDELEQEGLIIRIHGRGTFVNRAALQMKVNLLVGEEYRKIIERFGYQADVQLLRAYSTKAPESMADEMHLSKNERVYVVELMHYADNHPTILSIDRIPERFLTEIPPVEAWAKITFFEFLQTYGNIVARRDSIEIRAITKGEAENQVTPYAALMEHDALLLVDGLVFDQSNRPFDSGSVLFDTRYVRYNLIRNYET